MLVFEAKLEGEKQQYERLDEAIRTARFIRNSCIRYWMDNPKVGRYELSAYCVVLQREFPWASKLNSMARQASAERAWSAIARFYDNCKKKTAKKGFPRFKKHQTHGSVEYKTCGWVRFVSSKNGEFNSKVYEEQEFNLSYRLNQNS